MSSNRKSTLINKGIVFNVQYEMCDMVYRKLLELMDEIMLYEIFIEFKEISGKIKITAHNSSKNQMDFYYCGKNGNSHVGSVSFSKQLSISELECPVFCYIYKNKELIDQRSEIYSLWLKNIKLAMQKLLTEQKRFEDILDNINNIPMFSPTREVIIEKKQ